MASSEKNLSDEKLQEILSKKRHTLDSSKIKEPFRSQLEALQKALIKRSGNKPAFMPTLHNNMLYWMADHNPNAARTWWSHWCEIMGAGYLDSKEASLIYFACQAALNLPGFSKSAQRFLDFHGDKGKLFQALGIAQLVRSRLPDSEYTRLIAMCMPERIIERKPEQIGIKGDEQYAKAWFNSKKFPVVRPKGESEVEEITG